MRKRKWEIMEGVECKSSKLVDHSTVEYTRQNGDRVIRFHLTDIVIFHNNGDITLNTDNWQTVTTKTRLNTFSPFNIYQENSIWYVAKGEQYIQNEDGCFTKNPNRYVYIDGITFHTDGTVSGEGERPQKEIEIEKTDSKIC